MVDEIHHPSSVPSRQAHPSPRYDVHRECSPIPARLSFGKPAERGQGSIAKAQPQQQGAPRKSPSAFSPISRLTLQPPTFSRSPPLPRWGNFNSLAAGPVKTMAAPRSIVGSAVRTCSRSGILRSSPAGIAAPRCSASIIAPSRPFSTSNAARDATTNGSTSSTSDRPTHFGYETVTETEKTRRVAEVFSSVAETYDKMNDLMSFGWHRVWKYVACHSRALSPIPSPFSPP